LLFDLAMSRKSRTESSVSRRQFFKFGGLATAGVAAIGGLGACTTDDATATSSSTIREIPVRCPW
jgi:hypothetical protein